MRPIARGARWIGWTRWTSVTAGCCALLGMLSLGSPAFPQSQQPVPTLQARVTDLTGTLTAVQQSMLEEKLKDLEARKGSQLAVLLVPTTQPEDINQYGIRVLDQWKVGRKGIDDGAILLVAKEDREIRIEVGRGLEGSLTDALSSRIIAETLAPLFRQGDFYGGINAGLDQMIRIVDGEQLPAPDRRWQGREQPQTGQGISPVLPILFIAVFVGAPLLRALFGRAFGSILTGTVTGALVWFAGHALLMAGVVGLAALVFSLMVGLGGARGWSSYPRATGWGGGWGGGLGGFGGRWGGGGWGGGGGGGFTGGGGTGAGGGASGRW